MATVVGILTALSTSNPDLSCRLQALGVLIMVDVSVQKVNQQTENILSFLPHISFRNAEKKMPSEILIWRLEVGGKVEN